MFYYNGKNICLRCGKEHHALKILQFVRSYNPDKYTYTENGSKNRSGGLYERRVENKSVVIMASPDNGNRCHANLLDKYISKLHPRARELSTCNLLEYMLFQTLLSIGFLLNPAETINCLVW